MYGSRAARAAAPRALIRYGLRRRLLVFLTGSTCPISRSDASARLTFIACIPINSARSWPADSPSPESAIRIRNSLALKPVGSATPSRIGRLITDANRSVATNKLISLFFEYFFLRSAMLLYPDVTPGQLWRKKIVGETAPGATHTTGRRIGKMRGKNHCFVVGALRKQAL